MLYIFLRYSKNRLRKVLISSTFIKGQKNGQMAKPFYFWQTVIKRPNGNPGLNLIKLLGAYLGAHLHKLDGDRRLNKRLKVLLD